MPEPISIISDQEIKSDAFQKFLEELNVENDPDQIYQGRLSQGEHHIWIALNNDELKKFDESEIKLMSDKLGDQPKTHILLDLSKYRDATPLARHFIKKFAKRWNCVIYDSRKELYNEPIINLWCNYIKLSIFEDGFLNISRMEECRNKVQENFIKDVADSFFLNIQEIQTLISLPVVLLQWERSAEQGTLREIKKQFENFYSQEIKNKNNTKEQNFINFLNDELEISDDSIHKKTYLGVEEIRKKSKEKLNQIGKVDIINPAIESLFRTVTRMLWTAFECLAKDLWVATLNNNPELALDACGNKDFSIAEALKKYDFNLSENMGDILENKYRFTNKENIKDSYVTIFKHQKGDIEKILNHNDLAVLEKVRHILVHSAGKVDEKFIIKIKKFDQKLSSIAVGKTIPLDEEKLLRFADAVIETGCSLLEFVDEKVSSQSSK